MSRGSLQNFNSRAIQERGSNRATRGLRALRGNVVGGVQALADKKYIMHGRDDGESDSGVEKRGLSDPDPTRMFDLKQHHEKHRRYLGKRIGLSKDTGTEIAQAGDSVKHSAGA